MGFARPKGEREPDIDVCIGPFLIFYVTFLFDMPRQERGRLCSNSNVQDSKIVTRYRLAIAMVLMIISRRLFRRVAKQRAMQPCNRV